MASEIPTGTQCVQCGKTFEGTYAAVKVGEPMWVHDTCGRAYQEQGREYSRVMSEYYPCDDGCGKLHTFPPVELQLLVIDMGDCCVVKVEKGDPEAIFSTIIVSAYKDATAIISVPFSGFESVKASIEALDGEKPVPRIGVSSKIAEGLETYRLYTGDREYVMTRVEIDALSRLAGHPLPVYEGGKWTNLIDDCSCNFQQVPVGIWRYSR